MLSQAQRKLPDHRPEIPCSARVAITNSRIVGLDDKRVTIRYKDRNTTVPTFDVGWTPTF
jgi:hypothetical protein